VSDTQRIKTFIETMTYEEKQKALLDVEKGHFPFITISRQAGAGGLTLAKALLGQIEKEKEDPLLRGWHVCGRELCQLVTEDPNVNVLMSTLVSSEYRSQIEDMVSEMIAGTPPQDVVIKKMFRMIRTLATFGKVVLVGRGASILTRRLPLGIHVRLIAPLSTRVNRMMHLLGASEAEAKKTVQEQDKGRARLIDTFFNKNIEDPLLYDVVWNTDTVSIDEIARILVSMVKQKAKLMTSSTKRS